MIKKNNNDINKGDHDNKWWKILIKDDGSGGDLLMI